MVNTLGRRSLVVIDAIAKTLERKHADKPGIATVLARINQQDFSASAERPVTPKRQPACRHLPSALMSSYRTDRKLVPMLGEIAPELAWQVMPDEFADARVPNLMTDYAYATLVGWDGIFTGDDFAMGLFVIGPNQLYPAHRHRAPEMYWLLNGPSEWCFADDDWQRIEAGETVWNEPDAPHGTRTGNVPLLMIWAWCRDIDGPYSFVGFE